MKIFQNYEILFQKIQFGDKNGIEIAEYRRMSRRWATSGDHKNRACVHQLNAYCSGIAYTGDLGHYLISNVIKVYGRAVICCWPSPARRSQSPRGERHETSSPAQKLGS
jgi:hypothetical protein